jgi:hypothetical protein
LELGVTARLVGGLAGDASDGQGQVAGDGQAADLEDVVFAVATGAGREGERQRRRDESLQQLPTIEAVWSVMHEM